MRENEFERKVQEQFEELHLRPSASVWTQVERELQRKKRRRVVFYLSMLAGIGLLAYLGFTFLSTNDSGTTITKLQESTAPAAADNTAKRNQSNTNTVTDQHTQTTNEVTNAPLVQQGTNDTRGAVSPSIDNNLQKQTQQPDKMITYKPAKAETTKSRMSITQKAPAVKKITPVKEEKTTIAVNQDIPVITDNETDKSIATKTSQEKTTAITTADSVEKKDSAIAKTDVPEKEEPVVAIAEKKPGKGKKLRWGFDISGGVNLSRDKALSLPSGNLMSADFNQDVDYYLNNGPISGGVGSPFANPPVRPPSPVEAGVAFKAGVVAELKLTERSSLLTGLRYTYLSETIRVGIYGDTLIASSYTQTANGPAQRSVRGYYGEQQNLRRNNYHFIELPVSYQLQLNKGKKMQLLWNGGISAGYLLATNGLVYDTAARGIYYKKSKAFNKLHLNVISGLSFRFGDKNKLQWSVGPEFSMDMTRLLEHDVIVKQRYLLYGGLTARFILPGKKK